MKNKFEKKNEDKKEKSQNPEIIEEITNSNKDFSPEDFSGFSQEELIEKLTESMNFSRHLLRDPNSGLFRKEVFYKNLNDLVEKYFEGIDEKDEFCNFFRHEGGDEFVGIIKGRQGEIMVIFGDMSLLNLYNQLGGHQGGDSVIHSIGKTFQEVRKELDTSKSSEEILNSFHQLINEKIEKIDVDKLAGLEGKYAPKVHLDLGVAKIFDAEKVYQEIGLDLEKEEKIKRVANIAVNIADQKVTIDKAIWRVQGLAMMAEAVNKKEKIMQDIKNLTKQLAESDDFNSIQKEIEKLKTELINNKLEQKAHIFESQLGLSLKAIAGLQKKDLLDLAKIEDAEQRKEIIIDKVLNNLDLHNLKQVEEKQKETAAVYQMAKQSYLEGLKQKK